MYYTTDYEIMYYGHIIIDESRNIRYLYYFRLLFS